MGTCIGRRNIRYFVSFLSWTTLHAFITSLLTGLHLALYSEKILDGEKNDHDDETYHNYKRIMRVFSLVSLLYSFAFFLMLLCFAAGMHSSVMDNVTTNESIRKKWNAVNVQSRRD